MACDNLFNKGFDSLKCLLVLIAATLYRVLLFVTFLSASIGPATLVSYLYRYITQREVYPEVQPVICMMLISCWGEFSIGLEKRFFGQIIERLHNDFPNVMGLGRFTIHLVLYVVAFFGLYIAFENAYTISDRLSISLSEEERENMAKENESFWTLFFLLALSYLVFVTSRSFHKDLLLVVRNLPSVTFSVLNNWLIRIAFAITHLIANIFYFLPCMGIAYSSSNYSSYKDIGMTFHCQLIFTASMTGLLAALFEVNQSWPQRRGQLPFLFHENNIFGKSLLAHVLVVVILYFYYQPQNHPIVLASKFDSTNTDVVYFCLAVAFTTLHVVKFAVYGVLSLAHDYDEYDHRMHNLLDNDVVIDLPGDHGSSGSRTDGRPCQGSNLGNDVVEDGGMCARCIANAHNNNSDSHAPTTPSINQNNISRFGQPQQVFGLAAAKVEGGSAIVPRNENHEECKFNGNDITTSVESDEKRQQGVAAAESFKESYNVVKKITADAINDCQHSQSCKNSKVDLKAVNKNDSEGDCSLETPNKN